MQSGRNNIKHLYVVTHTNDNFMMINFHQIFLVFRVAETQ